MDRSCFHFSFPTWDQHLQNENTCAYNWTFHHQNWLQIHPLQTESNPVSFLIEICCSPQRRGLKSMHVFSLNCSKALKMTPFAFISKVTQMKNLLHAVERKRCWLLSLYKTCSYPGSGPNNRGRVGASGAVHCEWTSSSWSKTRRHQWISWIYILSWATILQRQTNNNDNNPVHQRASKDWQGPLPWLPMKAWAMESHAKW